MIVSSHMSHYLLLLVLGPCAGSRRVGGRTAFNNLSVSKPLARSKLLNISLAFCLDNVQGKNGVQFASDCFLPHDLKRNILLATPTQYGLPGLVATVTCLSPTATYMQPQALPCQTAVALLPHFLVIAITVTWRRCNIEKRRCMSTFSTGKACPWQAPRVAP